MLTTLTLYLHLLATCAAIGTIVITDLRIVARLVGYQVVIPPPQRLETVMVSVSLTVLYLSGAALMLLGRDANPDYLANPKLQAKLVLVAILTLNAFVLHRRIFPLLGQGRAVAAWSARQRLALAASVSVSNGLWLFCAFLGIARPWNGTVSISYVLTAAALVWLLMFCIVSLALQLGSREQPRDTPDWVDATIATISDFAGLASDKHFDPQVRGANQSDFADLQQDRRDPERPDRRQNQRG